MTTDEKMLVSLNRRLLLLKTALMVAAEGVPRKEREVVQPHLQVALASLMRAERQLREAIESWGVRPQQSIEAEPRRPWVGDVPQKRAAGCPCCEKPRLNCRCGT